MRRASVGGDEDRSFAGDRLDVRKGRVLGSAVHAPSHAGEHQRDRSEGDGDFRAADRFRARRKPKRHAAPHALSIPTEGAPRSTFLEHLQARQQGCPGDSCREMATRSVHVVRHRRSKLCSASRTSPLRSGDDSGRRSDDGNARPLLSSPCASLVQRKARLPREDLGQEVDEDAHFRGEPTGETPRNLPKGAKQDQTAVRVAAARLAGRPDRP